MYDTKLEIQSVKEGNWSSADTDTDTDTELIFNETVNPSD